MSLKDDVLYKALRDSQAENLKLRENIRLLSELCSGILGADDDDRVSEIRVHFSDRPTMYLRNAIAMTLDAIDQRPASHPASWLDCPDCRALSKSGAEPPRCTVFMANELAAQEQAGG